KKKAKMNSLRGTIYRGGASMGSAVAVMEVPPVGRINVARVILGGIVAGLVINISEFVLNQVVLGADMVESLARMNLPPVGGAAIPIFIILGFLDGFVLVWLYAAIRPRFGAGPKTAVIAALAAWFFVSFNVVVSMHVLGMYHRRLLAISTTWELGQSIVAALAGGALYTEK
ncbi:MAG TPA: hypothetical protein VGZ27_08105, partial [Vicinamibacterales bacterium]|nr:hypothetical protein [Vicinamibacterales bacterium]